MKSIFKFTIIILSLVLLSSSAFSADTNGIWHLAKDVRPGVFGDDEGDVASTYSFQNPVVFYKPVSMEQNFEAKSQTNLKDVDVSSNMDVGGNLKVIGTSSFTGLMTTVNIKANRIDVPRVATTTLTTGSISGSSATFSGTVRGGAFIYTSDERLKTNVKTVQNPIETINKLEGVTFNWKTNQEADIGFIAQDVEKVLPELVKTNEYGIKGVKYANIVPVLVEAVKAQEKKIEELEARLEKLEN